MPDIRSLLVRDGEDAEVSAAKEMLADVVASYGRHLAEIEGLRLRFDFAKDIYNIERDQERRKYDRLCDNYRVEAGIMEAEKNRLETMVREQYLALGRLLTAEKVGEPIDEMLLQSLVRFVLASSVVELSDAWKKDKDLSGDLELWSGRVDELTQLAQDRCVAERMGIEKERASFLWPRDVSETLSRVFAPKRAETQDELEHVTAELGDVQRQLAALDEVIRVLSLSLDSMRTLEGSCQQRDKLVQKQQALHEKQHYLNDHLSVLAGIKSPPFLEGIEEDGVDEDSPVYAANRTLVKAQTHYFGLPDGATPAERQVRAMEWIAAYCAQRVAEVESDIAERGAVDVEPHEGPLSELVASYCATKDRIEKTQTYLAVEREAFKMRKAVLRGPSILWRFDSSLKAISNRIDSHERELKSLRASRDKAEKQFSTMRVDYKRKNGKELPASMIRSALKAAPMSGASSRAEIEQYREQTRALVESSWHVEHLNQFVERILDIPVLAYLGSESGHDNESVSSDADRRDTLVFREPAVHLDFQDWPQKLATSVDSMRTAVVNYVVAQDALLEAARHVEIASFLREHKQRQLGGKKKDKDYAVLEAQESEWKERLLAAKTALGEAGRSLEHKREKVKKIVGDELAPGQSVPSFHDIERWVAQDLRRDIELLRFSRRPPHLKFIRGLKEGLSDTFRGYMDDVERSSDSYFEYGRAVERLYEIVNGHRVLAVTPIEQWEQNWSLSSHEFLEELSVTPLSESTPSVLSEDAQMLKGSIDKLITASVNYKMAYREKEEAQAHLELIDALLSANRVVMKTGIALKTFEQDMAQQKQHWRKQREHAEKVMAKSEKRVTEERKKIAKLNRQHVKTGQDPIQTKDIDVAVKAGLYEKWIEAEWYQAREKQEKRPVLTSIGGVEAAEYARDFKTLWMESEAVVKECRDEFYKDKFWGKVFDNARDQCLAVYRDARDYFRSFQERKNTLYRTPWTKLSEYFEPTGSSALRAEDMPQDMQASCESMSQLMVAYREQKEREIRIKAELLACSSAVHDSEKRVGFFAKRSHQPLQVLRADKKRLDDELKAVTQRIVELDKEFLRIQLLIDTLNDQLIAQGLDPVERPQIEQHVLWGVEETIWQLYATRMQRIQEQSIELAAGSGDPDEAADEAAQPEDGFLTREQFLALTSSEQSNKIQELQTAIEKTDEVLGSYYDQELDASQKATSTVSASIERARALLAEAGEISDSRGVQHRALLLEKEITQDGMVPETIDQRIAELQESLDSARARSRFGM